MKPSIQRRLFGILGVFVVINTLMWGGLSLLLAYVVEDEIIDLVLKSQTTFVQAYYDTNNDLPSLQFDELRLYESLDAVPQAVRPEIRPGVPGGEIFTADKTHYHYRWLSLPDTSSALLLAEVSPWLVVTNISFGLLVVMASGFAGALLLGLVAVFTIARITTRPVRELTVAIGQSPRPSPLPHGESGDEVGVLASAMDTALNSLQQALDREVVFTRDISHELRTPLTTLRNAITLLPESARHNMHVRQLTVSSQEIEKILSGLLALARAESLAVGPIALRPLLEHLLLKRSDLLEEKEFQWQLDIPDDAQIVGNEQVMALLLGNLLDNALHYAVPATLSVRYTLGALVLENPLPIAQPSPHPQSLQHGLSLVERLATAQGCHFSAVMDEQVFRASISWEQ
jgi:signal transduction histidine kinase